MVVQVAGLTKYDAPSIIADLGSGWCRYRRTFKVWDNGSGFPAAYGCLYFQIEQGEYDGNPAYWTVGDVVVRKAMGGELIVNGAITADKIQVDSLSAISANLGTIQVGTANIADAAITTAKIGDLQVDTLKIADYAVTVSSGVVQPPTTYNVGHPNYYTSIAADKVYINERIILTHNFSTMNANGYTRIDIAVTSEWRSTLGNSTSTSQNIGGTTWIDVIVDSQVVTTIKPSLYSDTYWNPGDETIPEHNQVSRVYSYTPGALYLKSLILSSGSHTLQLRLRTQSSSYGVYKNPSAVTPEYLRLGELTVMVAHFKK